MQCSCAQAVVVAAAVLAMAVTIAVAEADPDPTFRRPHPPPCYPKVHYVTKYQTKYREVSVEGLVKY